MTKQVPVSDDAVVEHDGGRLHSVTHDVSYVRSQSSTRSSSKRTAARGGCSSIPESQESSVESPSRR